MNQFTKKTNPSEPGIETGQTKSPWVAGLLIKMGMMMVVIFAACYARVHLNDKTEQLASEKNRITKLIQEKQTEIQVLRLEVAKLKSPENVNSKIREYNLALRAANPSQIRYMKRTGESVVMSPSTYGGDTRIADTSANGRQSAAGEIR